MQTPALNENERLDDLQLKGLKIIQRTDWFCFGIDAVLLAYFANIEKGAKVMDLGTGNGIIPLLLIGRYRPSEVVGVEIQQPVAALAERNVILNGLTDTVRIINEDIRNCPRIFPQGYFDAVVSNPPYMAGGNGFVGESQVKAASRHELLCSLEDILKTSVKLLKFGGTFTMVHRPSRLTDILCHMRASGIEPKVLRFVHPKPDDRPVLVLVKGRRSGGSGLQVLEPLCIHNADGIYTDEIRSVYREEEIKRMERPAE